MLIGYATSAGQVANDGAGKNGPYAIALANALSSPTVLVSDVFRQVRRHVREATLGAQIPWVSSSIENEIVLRTASPMVAPAATDGSDWLASVADIVWRYIGESGQPRYYSLFGALFPKSAHTQVALKASTTSATRDGANRGAGDVPSTDFAMADISVPSGEYGTTVDRNPIPEMRFWPERLPDVKDGLSSLVTRCDLLAGDPDDPAGVTPGRHMALVSTRDAIAECGFEIAKSPGNARIVFQFARALDIAGEVEQAVVFYENAAELGYSQAMVNLGHLYRFGVKVPSDYKKAFDYYKRAAQIGNPQARMGLAILYGNGWGVAQSTEESLLWARLAGSQGWLNAYDMLATHFATGRGVEKNLDVAFTLLLYASQMGQTNAMSNLGLAYIKGEGVEKDESLGMQWLDKANEAGNRYAAYHLARRLITSRPDEAARLLEISAERDFPQARIDLAQLYETRHLYDDAYFQIRLAQRLGYKKNVQDLAVRLEQKLSREDLKQVSKRVDQWMRDNGY
jgi:TPR repeat protein